MIAYKVIEKRLLQKSKAIIFCEKKSYSWIRGCMEPQKNSRRLKTYKSANKFSRLRSKHHGIF